MSLRARMKAIYWKQVGHLAFIVAACFLALATLPRGVAAEVSTEIVFSDKPDKTLTGVVNSVYGDFLRAHKNIKIMTAKAGTMDGAFFVRFVSNETCYDDKTCDTVELKQSSDGSWKSVFEHSTRNLSLIGPDMKYFSENMPTLIVDKRVKWVWAGFNHYLPLVSSLGKSFSPVVPANKDLVATMNDVLDKRFHLGVATEYRETPMSLGDGDLGAVPFYFVTAYKTGLCSNDVGCPHAIIYPKAGGMGVLWAGFATGIGVIMETENKGMHDIALGNKWGYEILRYNGKIYEVVETSYPSSVTPMP